MVLTVDGSLEQACDLVDNRLMLALASRKIGRGRLPRLFLNRRAIVQTIDDTFHYVERQPSRAALLVSVTIERGTKLEGHNCGMALRAAPDGRLSIYIDTYRRAIERGILNGSVHNKAAAWAVAGVLLLALFTPPGWFAVGFMLIASPLLVPLMYVHQKRRFFRQQEIMRAVLDVFSKEFPVLETVDTKDWINFFGRVKSATRDMVVPV